jgi:hypothetical protein
VPGVVAIFWPDLVWEIAGAVLLTIILALNRAAHGKRTAAAA